LTLISIQKIDDKTFRRREQILNVEVVAQSKYTWELTFRGICDGGDSLAQSSFGTRISKYKQNSLLETKPPLAQSRC